MAETYDVASRLAQGRPAVDTVQGYVWACHQLGFAHQDLTLNPSQVGDWYGTEEGMDLAALQRGCLALEAAVRSSQDALALQERQLVRLPAVWQGVGGQAARDFLRRHGDASVGVAAAVQTAAEALGSLREELWRAVCAKVDAVVAIEGRAAGARDEWTAAARTVTTGVGDRAAASELVDQAVKPFVHNAIGSEWLTAMQTAVASVTAAYDRAITEIEAEPSRVFEVPGDFGPGWTPPPASEPECDDEPRCPPATAAAPAPAAPAPAPAAAAPAATAPASWAPVAPTPATFPATEPVAPPAPAAPPVPALGSMGSGMPDLGGGLSGLGQQFADSLSGLLGGGIGGDVPEPPELELDEPELDEPEPEDADDEDEADEGDEEPEFEPPQPVDEPIVAGEAEPVEEACEPPVEPVAAPAPEPAPPPAEPLPPAEPAVAEQTPCEIAADEVPQIGEPSTSPE